MKASDLAKRLNGIELNDITRSLGREASDAGLVIVYGVGTNEVHFIGSIESEADVPEGGTIHLDAEGLLPDVEDLTTDAERSDYYTRRRFAFSIDAEYAKNGFLWTMITLIPHHRFVVMEDRTRYCRGIVFEMAALGSKQNEEVRYTGQ